jgi:hypothetical protein
VGTKDFEELLASFRRHGVRALIVGAHALAHHARPRYTKDLDVFIEASEANARRILEALEEFGFGDAGISTEDLTTPEMIIQLGYPPSRVDLLTSISGVSFADAWAGRVEGMVLGQKFPLIGRDQLVANKRASGRAQDLADLELLESDE